ncbi:hypothetical protein [Aliarcobacter cryaerophilus]|jgi:hypothetical protein|uniref:hypothetical protein n=1 Tax=Aliarcobacter cryaerophilus TaxID=28198 RepID=UPI00112F656E|nr:hypothetical protein [Aliarcobacter cryaerophilus]MBP6714967.1 hypothetical protein [Aliarcobacter sp.]MBP7227409.1 hypothetical protein [Aliarcobacter sp.]MBP7749009.1 hypothetical protein [Aliarcobacter sp.]
MNDNKPNFSIDIVLKDDDIEVTSTSDKNFIMNQKEKTLLLIALFQLKEKIINNELDIEVLSC